MIWLLSFFLLVFAVVAMSIGVLLKKKPLSGSCGGLNQLGLKKDCPICGKKNTNKK